MTEILLLSGTLSITYCVCFSLLQCPSSSLFSSLQSSKNSQSVSRRKGRSFQTWLRSASKHRLVCLARHICRVASIKYKLTWGISFLFFFFFLILLDVTFMCQSLWLTSLEYNRWINVDSLEISWRTWSNCGKYIVCFFFYQPPDGKENIKENSWESQLDTSVLEQSREKILQILNAGCLKELKGLQQIGDKKA